MGIDPTRVPAGVLQLGYKLLKTARDRNEVVRLLEKARATTLTDPDVSIGDRRRIRGALKDLHLDPDLLGGVAALLAGQDPLEIMPPLTKRLTELIKVKDPRVNDATIVRRFADGVDYNVVLALRDDPHRFQMLHRELRRLRTELTLTRKESALRPVEPTPLQPLVKLPFRRNPAFTGRQKLLELLADATAGSSRAITNRQALADLGGVGKTQLANEYAHWALEEKQVAIAWWIRAEEHALIISDLAELAWSLGEASMAFEGPGLDHEDGAPSEARAAAAALRGLRRMTHPWLLVFDNAPSPSLVAPYLPDGGAGQVVITSRHRGGWRGLAEELEVPVFDEDTAIEYLLKATGRDDRLGATLVTKRLGGHALALSQAAGYVAQTGRSFAEYCDRLERDSGLHARPADTGAYRGTTAAVIAESRSHIAQVAPAANDLLDVLSYLDPSNIAVAVLEPYLEGAGLGVDALDDCVAALAGYCLINVDESGITIHRLVQELVRIGHQTSVPAKAALRLLSVQHPSLPQDPAAWNECTRLLPHVIAIAATWPSEHYDLELGRLLARSGAFLGASGDAVGAVSLLERADDVLARSRDGVLDALQAKVDLAAALRVLGRLNDATTVGEGAVELATESFGLGSTQLATAENSLALTLREFGRVDRALVLQERALEVRRAELGPEHPETLRTMSDVAFTLKVAGRLREAKGLHEQALELRTRALGTDHPDTLTSANNLASTLQAMGSLKRARELFERAVEGRAQILGEEHPSTLTAMNNLASIKRSQGEFEDARALLEVVIASRKRILGVDHPATLLSISDLSGTLRDLSRFDEAQSLGEQAVEGRARIFGAEHPRTLWSMNGLAMTLRAAGRLDEARELHEKVLRGRRRVLGEEHPETLSTMNNLGVLLEVQGDLTRAREMHTHVLNIRMRTVGPENPRTLISMTNLARVCQAEGAHAEGLKIHRQVLESRRRILGEDHPRTLTTLHHVGEALAALGDLDAALAQLEEVVDARERKLGPDHADLLASKAELASLLARRGDRDRCRALLAEVLEGRRRVLGERHPETVASREALEGLTGR